MIHWGALESSLEHVAAEYEGYPTRSLSRG